MAESHHMLLDVKLDLKDGKCELYYLKVIYTQCFGVLRAIVRILKSPPFILSRTELGQMLCQDWSDPMLPVLLENQFLLPWRRQRRPVCRYTYQHTWGTCWNGRIAHKSIGVRSVLEEQSKAMQIVFCVRRKGDIHRAYALAEGCHRLVGRLSQKWVGAQTIINGS